MLLSPDMAGLRERARTKVNEHSNAQVSANICEHFALLRAEMDDPAFDAIAERREELLAAIEAAKTPAEIEQVTASLT